jgi:hypothetical protein
MLVDICTPERWAELLLANVVDATDYARAAEEVRKISLGPATIPRQPPLGV